MEDTELTIPRTLTKHDKAEYFSLERAAAVDGLVTSWWHLPLIWGKFDCVHLVADMAVRLGKPDPAKGMPEYSSKRQARKALTSLGYKTLTDLVDATYPRIDNITNTIKGDIIELKGRDSAMNALAIVTSPGIAVLAFCASLKPDSDEVDTNDKKVQKLTYHCATGRAWRIE